VLPALGRHTLKCANPECGATIVDFGNLSRLAIAIVIGAVVGLFAGGMVLKILGADETLQLVLGPLLGIGAAIAFEIWARADIRKRLAQVAAAARRR
jgi:hypothetical protein